MLLVLQTWNIPASKYYKGVYILTEGSWGGLESWDGTYVLGKFMTASSSIEMGHILGEQEQK